MINFRRVIPVLLISGGYLVKPVKFKKPIYIGDPINAVKIFNDMEADELIVIDIDSGKGDHQINFSLIEEISSEAFMPVSYGGGIRNSKQGIQLINSGLEKVVLNSIAAYSPEIISELASELGSQAVSVCVDYKERFGSQTIYVDSGKQKLKGKSLIQYCTESVKHGAGEILLQNIEREGTLSGYDLETLKLVKDSVEVPVSILGGAGSLSDFELGFKTGASAVCAGTIFVTTGKHKAVLINYPTPEEMVSLRNC